MSTINFSLKLRAARMAAGLSLEDLVLKTGYIVTRQSINTYEMGKRNPKPHTIKKIASALNVGVDFLCSDELTIEMDSLILPSPLISEQQDFLLSMINYKCEYINYIENALKYPHDNLDVFEIKDLSISNSVFAAKYVRDALNCGYIPIHNLCNLLETKGFIVLNLKIPNKAGICGALFHKRPVIAIDFEMYARRPITLRYEVAKMVARLLFKNISGDNISRFAFYFLFPDKSIYEELAGCKRKYFLGKELERIYVKYGIPILPLITELLHLKLINEEYYKHEMVRCNQINVDILCKNFFHENINREVVLKDFLDIG